MTKAVNILIVDDMPVIRSFINITIMSVIKKDVIENIHVDEAQNGKAAQAKLEAGPYDLVLCDWNMPGMNGSELLQWMKSQESLREIPFVMITANNEKKFIMEALQMGVTGYVLKPLTVEVLDKTINSLLSDIITKKQG